MATNPKHGHLNQYAAWLTSLVLLVSIPAPAQAEDADPWRGVRIGPTALMTWENVYRLTAGGGLDISIMPELGIEANLVRTGPRQESVRALHGEFMARTALGRRSLRFFAALGPRWGNEAQPSYIASGNDFAARRVLSLQVRAGIEYRRKWLGLRAFHQFSWTLASGECVSAGDPSNCESSGDTFGLLGAQFTVWMDVPRRRPVE